MGARSHPVSDSRQVNWELSKRLVHDLAFTPYTYQWFLQSFSFAVAKHLARLVLKGIKASCLILSWTVSSGDPYPVVLVANVAWTSDLLRIFFQVFEMNTCVFVINYKCFWNSVEMLPSRSRISRRRGKKGIKIQRLCFEEGIKKYL